MRWFLIVIFSTIFFQLALTSWNRCNRLHVQQTICNRTASAPMTQEACSKLPKSNCYFDNASSECTCIIIEVCTREHPGDILGHLDFQIYLQTDANQGSLLVYDLNYQGQNTYWNSSLLPTSFLVYIYAYCDGPLYNSALAFEKSISPNISTNFSMTNTNCNDRILLYVFYEGPPIYNYLAPNFGLMQLNGAYFVQYNYLQQKDFGRILEPETNFFPIAYGNFSCAEFQQIPNPPQFDDYCTRYVSTSWYNTSNVLTVTYDYTNGEIVLSMISNNFVVYAEILNGIMYLRVDGASEQNKTSQNITLDLTNNYLHEYTHNLNLAIANFTFYHDIILYNNHSYSDEADYFTYDNRCTATTTIYDPVSKTALSNDFCCDRWANKGVVCPTGWSTSNVNPNECYKFVDTTIEWVDARAICKSLTPGSNLVSIDSAFSNSEITGKLNKECTNYHIGLHYNDTDWVWVDNDKSMYRNWKSGYPKNNTDNMCATISTADGTWQNHLCGFLACYICKLVLK